MTERTSESEPSTGEPVSNGPSAVPEPESLPPADAAVPASEFPPPPSETDPQTAALVEKIQRSVRGRARTTEIDRIRTLEDRLLKLEELLISRLPEKPSNEVPPPAPVAYTPETGAAPVMAPPAPVASMIAEAPVATVIEAPVASVAPAAPPASEAAASLPRGSWRSWFLIQNVFQSWNNFRLFLRMYVDPRYRMSWLGRLVPFAFVLFFIFSDWNWFPLRLIFFWNMVDVIGPLINKLLLVVFAWVTVKVLGREMRRYQDTTPDVPDVLRWNNR